MNKCTINDREYTSDNPNITYDEILAFIGKTGVITMTYRKRISHDVTRSGILSPGKALEDFDGLIINAYDTSSA